MLSSLYGASVNTYYVTTGPILFKFKHNLYFRPEYRSKVILKNIKSTSALAKALFFRKVQICTLQKPGPNFKIGVQTITLKIKNKIHRYRGCGWAFERHLIGTT